MVEVTETIKLYRDQGGNYVIQEADGPAILFTGEELQRLKAAIMAATLYEDKT